MKDYIEYFSGLQRSYGVCYVENGHIDPETGKKKWKHEWTNNSITDQDYEDHIKGIKSIGIQPCTDEGMARFGAIDVDQYPIDRKFYLGIIQDKNLPIIPILSKSGGLHLYVFTTRLVKAKEIRNFLEELLFLLDTENFFVSEIKVKIDEKKNELEAELKGDDSNNYEAKIDVKAVTYNEMFVKKEKGKWVTQVVVDV